MDKIFGRLDCDNVGDKIELALYKEDTQTAQKINDTIKKHINLLCTDLKQKLNAEILLIGSDDILFKVAQEDFSLPKLAELKEDFSKSSGFTISIGIGNTLLDCLNHLQIAKYSGKNIIIDGR